MEKQTTALDIYHACLEMHPEYVATEQFNMIEEYYGMGLYTTNERYNSHIDAMVTKYGAITFKQPI